MSLHELLRLVGEAVLAGHDVDPVEAVRLPGLGHGVGAGQLPQRAGPPAGLGLVAGLGSDVERGAATGRELAVERVLHDAGAALGRQHARVDAGELDPQERQAHQDQQRGGDRGDRPGPSHDGLREPVPAALLDLPGVAVQRLLPALEAERVHARAEHGEHGRQHGQRHERRRERHQHAAVAHREQEPQVEHDQRAHGGRHGDGAEQHGPAGGPHRPLQRLGGVDPLGQLLAEARDDEQRVVDREAEPGAGDQVDGEHRHRLDLVHEPHPDEGGDDRRAAHQHREQGGDHAAEDDERQQEEQREGEHLGAREVLLDLLADLGEGELAAAGGHARLALHARLELLGERRRRRPRCGRWRAGRSSGGRARSARRARRRGRRPPRRRAGRPACRRRGRSSPAPAASRPARPAGRGRPCRATPSARSPARRRCGRGSTPRRGPRSRRPSPAGRPPGRRRRRRTGRRRP